MVKEIEVEKVVEKPVIVEVEKIVVQEKIVEVEQPFFSRFGEAPMLATLVRRRELDPVEERLPESPLVIPVKEDIGLYGGTWNMGYKGLRRPVSRFPQKRSWTPWDRRHYRQVVPPGRGVVVSLGRREALHIPSAQGDEVV